MDSLVYHGVYLLCLEWHNGIPGQPHRFNPLAGRYPYLMGGVHSDLPRCFNKYNYRLFPRLYSTILV